MPTPQRTLRQINDLILYLVNRGLADAQYFAFQRSMGRELVQVSFQGAEHVSVALRNRSYDEIYERLREVRAFNVKMLDGALMQMMYLFADGVVRRHRLAFFPAPHLEEFQNNEEIYLDDEVDADVVARNVVPFPVRFDYDARVDRRDAAHPLSHLTLGQYRNCRIPVSAPVTPSRFVDFILRNFYHTAFIRYADRLPTGTWSFAETIRPDERGVAHVVVPA